MQFFVQGFFFLNVSLYRSLLAALKANKVKNGCLRISEKRLHGDLVVEDELLLEQGCRLFVTLENGRYFLGD